MIEVLENHQRFVSTRKHILGYPGEAERHMDARASLQDVAADQEIEVTGVSAYPDWRQEAERLTAAVEALLSDKGTYGVHLDRRSQWVDATLYLERRDGVYADDAKKRSRVQFGREDGALGPLATRGVVEGDWSGVW